jgi:hypothetical protein
MNGAPPLPGGVEFVAYQLRVEQQLFGYVYVTQRSDWNDLATQQLAASLFASGITDVRDLAFHRSTESTTVQRSVSFACGQDTCTELQSVPVTYEAGWFYNKRTNARIDGIANIVDYCEPGWRDAGDAQYWATCPTLPPPGAALQFRNFDLAERWKCDFLVQFVGDDQVAAFVPQVWRETSTWESLRSAIIFWFGAVSFIVPGLGAAIGGYVFGAAFAAAYPAIVSIATNVALNAALGGADIEHAVGRALASYAGAELGGFTGGQFDSDLVGKLTAATTTALLTNADVGQAVASALLRAGASGTLSTGSPAIVSAPAPTSGTAMATNQDDEFGNVAPSGGFVDYLGTPGDVTDVELAALGGSPNLDPGTGFDPGGQFVDFSTTPQAFDPSGMDTGIPDPNAPPLVTGNDGSGWSWDDALAKVTQLALTALQLNKAYQASQGRAPKAPSPSQTVNKNGTVTTRNPNGTVTTARPVVGQPVVAADGTIVMNNGDGTYTTIDAGGHATNLRYPPEGSAAASSMFAGLDTATMIRYGVIGLGLVFAVSRFAKARR